MSSTDQTVSGAPTQAADGAGPSSNLGRSAEDAPDLRHPRQGEQVGGFVVLGKLGAGGMAVVYRAFDPDLERMVALKLHGGFGSTASTARLMREARSMARLTHPNVLTIYEVGTHGDDVFIAMELAVGGTLRDWIRDEHPDWREIVARFVAAGRGLAAAHELGIVHRDFKAENVLLDADGRPRVADFGLAREQDAALESKKADLTTSGLERLTDAGAALGTPLYMPPEQYGVGKITAASDQFAFCASLYEALYGKSPFSGDTLGSRLQHILDGDIAEPTRSEVPRRIFVTLRRGLAADPTQRFEDMPALLRELSVDPGTRRRRVVGAVGVAAIAVVGAFVGAKATKSDPCAVARNEIAATWNEDRRATVAAAIARATEPVAVAGALAPLDDFATAWTAQRVQTCEATQVRAQQSTTVLEQRMACLDRRRATFEGIVRALEIAEPATLSKTPEIVGQLPDLETCEDPARDLDPVPPPPPEQAAEVAELRAELAVIDTLYVAAAIDGLPARLDVVQARAAKLGYAPLVVDARYAQAQVADERGRYADARASYEHVMVDALQAGRDNLAARAGAKLAFSVGIHDGERDGARRLLRLARAAEARRPSAAAQRIIERVDAALAHARGDNDAAVAAARRAMELSMEFGSVRSARSDRLTYGIMLDDAGRGDEAVAEFERVLAELTDEYGPDDGRLHAPLRALAVHYAQHGDMQRAAPLFLRNAEIVDKNQGGRSLPVVEALRDAAIANLVPSRRREAKRIIDRAQDILAELPGDNTQIQVQLLQAAGQIALLDDDCEAAMEIHRKIDALATEAPLLIASSTRIICMARREGPDAAVELAERFLASTTAQRPANADTVAQMLVALAVATADSAPKASLDAVDRATAALDELGSTSPEDRLSLAMARARAAAAVGEADVATQALDDAITRIEGAAPFGGWSARSQWELARLCAASPSHAAQADGFARAAAASAKAEDDPTLEQEIDAWRRRLAR